LKTTKISKNHKRCAIWQDLRGWEYISTRFRWLRSAPPPANIRRASGAKDMCRNFSWTVCATGAETIVSFHYAHIRGFRLAVCEALAENVIRETTQTASLRYSGRPDFGLAHPLLYDWRSVRRYLNQPPSQHSRQSIMEGEKPCPEYISRSCY
jgi:hypothetical protein